ncbi:dihydrolipoamide acetyltransferase family protein [Bacillus sp. V33-4]|uniref:dihydrolipoamide acetyltransferase family protein n=1 Tax=Bacillus sp. V33-4 TaxID=2054169 RepID=UPI000C788401|nr:dihydrolipoamide acetyltransferase family protein [Bacillus sp. V33-4]PLR81544.1 dihydrolipoyllysine acetyltransferase [Bacillus sp. V33-4]
MVEVKLHDIGEGMTEAEINFLFVKPGDTVKEDEALAEVQTDKMTAEIPAPSAGVVKELLVQQGQTVKVGSTLFILETAALPDAKKQQPVAAAAKLSKRILAAPYTRKIAREQGVSIEGVTGSGPGGRITDEDVIRHAKLKAHPHKEEANLTFDSHTSDRPQAIPAKSIPFRGRRKQIAKKMVQSIYTIPHCTHFEEIDVTELIKFREELKTTRQYISATSFFIKALSLALKDFPIFNAVLNEETEMIDIKTDHHIGLAIDAEDGLIVPVIRDVKNKTIRTIHDEVKELTEKALKNELKISEITGGSFTVSNVGPLGGSLGATPIIQHPEVALVSFHKTKKMPVVIGDDEIAIRSIMNISMSFDHRVADGATAVRFTNRLAELIENPKMLVLEMV